MPTFTSAYAGTLAYTIDDGPETKITVSDSTSLISFKTARRTLLASAKSGHVVRIYRIV